MSIFFGKQSFRFSNKLILQAEHLEANEGAGIEADLPTEQADKVLAAEGTTININHKKLAAYISEY